MIFQHAVDEIATELSINKMRARSIANQMRNNSLEEVRNECARYQQIYVHIEAIGSLLSKCHIITSAVENDLKILSVFAFNQRHDKWSFLFH
jgi:hypothetical protein